MMRLCEIKSRIEEDIKHCEEELREAGTSYNAVLNNEDTTAYGEDAENNNFTAGRISGLMSALILLEELI